MRRSSRLGINRGPQLSVLAEIENEAMDVTDTTEEPDTVVTNEDVDMEEPNEFKMFLLTDEKARVVSNTAAALNKKDDDELEAMRAVPTEYHISVMQKVEESMFRLTVLGGHDSESSKHSEIGNRIVQYEIELKRNHIFLTSTKRSFPIRPWVKTQKTPHMNGSFLASLTKQGAVLLQDRLFVYGGYDRRYNTMSGDIYVLENLENIDDIMCTMIPGQVIQQQSKMLKEDLDARCIQKGELPEVRGGHAMFSCEDGCFVSLGGYTIKSIGNKKTPSDCKENLMKYDVIENKWSAYEMFGDKTLLARNSFGSVSVHGMNRIFVTGGISYAKRPYEVLNMKNLLSILVQGKQATVTTVDLDMIPKQLHSFTMSCSKGKLYMQGGLTEKNIPNGKLYIANHQTKSVEIVEPPTFIDEKMKVFGSSSLWLVEDDTLLLIGGSSPPLGYGGRSIFMYSRRKNDVDFCDLGEKHCLVSVDHDGDTRLIECDKCELDIHFYCDPKLRKAKKVPQKYVCPICTGKVTDKKRRKGS